ncbi:MAG: acyclic terpene utilization AtuA family protein [Pseudomonadota bacterium]
MSKTIRIGGASGYWGESDMAWGQLLAAKPDYLVFDYLAEITMSILAQMRRREPLAGYATDFVSQISRHLPEIAKQGVKIISNAGGVNPESCAAIVREAIAKAGLDLTVSVVMGDDLMGQLDVLNGSTEIFSEEAFPDPDKIVSANAYLGAFPIAQALDAGADIIITGRCVDSAVTLGALIHEFGWDADDLNKLAQGSLIGHLIECGPQVTGGNFTDWHLVADGIADIGYPIAEVQADGTCIITKPEKTGGIVNRGAVAEQMLYEIGDPSAYILPDVICDFTQVNLKEIGPNQVRVTGAKGRGRPDRYKVSVTVSDGYRISILFFMIGEEAVKKAEIFHEATLTRARLKLRDRNLGDYDQVELERVGDDSHFGGGLKPREIAFRISARHEDPKACAILLKEASGLGLATPPGLVIYNGARPKPQAVTRLFSTLVPKEALNVAVDDMPFTPPGSIAHQTMTLSEPSAPTTPTDTAVPLEQLAWLRSGDKGDKANIGVAARRPEFMPYIWAALTKETVRDYFDHFVQGEIERWYLPGSDSLNILMDRALGGGGMASLRNDPQGKSFGQVLASLPIPVPSSLL